jgi:hypothetical protein
MAAGDVPLPGPGRAGNGLGDAKTLLRLGKFLATGSKLLDDDVIGVFARDVGLGGEAVGRNAVLVTEGRDVDAVPERRAVLAPIEHVGGDRALSRQGLGDAQGRGGVGRAILQEPTISPDDFPRGISRQSLERRVHIDNRIVFPARIGHCDGHARLREGVEQRTGESTQRVKRLARLRIISAHREISASVMTDEELQAWQ